jgi:acyl carrier protein
MTMSEESARLERVEKVMRGVFALAPGQAVTRATNSSDVDGWDSLSHSLLILGVEDEFGVDLPLDKTFELKDVGELVDLIGVATPRP